MTLLASDQPIGPDTTVEAFQAHTGTVHLRESHPWGVGAACTNRMVLGLALLTQYREITCGRCLGKAPETYEVRLPDKRYKTGYRVVHSGVATAEEAQALAEEIGEKAYVEAVPIEDGS